jgi:hypothetical protein
VTEIPRLGDVSPKLENVTSPPGSDFVGTRRVARTTRKKDRKSEQGLACQVCRITPCEDLGLSIRAEGCPRYLLAEHREI